MVELLEANWLLVVIALVIGLLVAWWIFAGSRRTTVEREEVREDSPAKRNQALIDSPPVAAHNPANAQDVAAAPLGTDSEAGDGTPLREAMDETAKAPPPPPTTPSPAGAATATPSATAAASTPSNDLSRIKGVGPKLVSLLHENGVTTLAQIAAWEDAEIDRIDAKLGRFQGRIRRDNWVEQAKLLSGNDISAYEAKFGRTS